MQHSIILFYFILLYMPINNNYNKYKKKYLELKNINRDTTKMYVIYNSRKTKCFPIIKDVDRSQIQMTNISEYSVTCTDDLNTIINKYFNHTNLTITDGTSNVGGDTIRLGLRFDKVNAVELDPTTSKLLTHNIELYNLSDKVTVINDSIITQLPNLTQDIVYIDAPWGGRNYFKKKHMKLFLDNMEISSFYNHFKHKASLFLFKVPRNYDFNYFIKKTKIDNLDIHSVRQVDKISFYIIAIKTNIQ